tara:strand:+ start:1045 stop:3222 length:2178 start_codon:yes stop_codon:yes gene_type:complete
MSDINDENLPSIEDYSDSSDDLPSINDFLIEEELPSVQEFVVPEEEEKDSQTIEDAEGNAFIEVTDVIKAPEWAELVRLVNNVREEIPDIPEIKSYDKELKELEEEINRVRTEIPKNEIEDICHQIDLVRKEIDKNAADIPEIKYYDEQVDNIENKIDLIQQEIVNLPQPKYYEEDLQTIKEELQVIRDEIPTFPTWVNEVNEVPDFSWIGKTFSVIDDDFIKVGDRVKELKVQFDADIHEVNESLDTKDFERRVEIDEIKENFKNTKDKIYEELKETAVRIWEHHDRFKDDDRKLKKHVLSKLNEARQKIEHQIDNFKSTHHESNKTLTNYFEGLKEEISNLPKVKYYDNPIKDLQKDISNLSERVDDKVINIAELYKIVEELRSTQKELTEGLLNEPPDTKTKDPLTPLDKEATTLQQLASQYRLFTNRVQEQLATFGGGGAVQLQYLDDIVGVGTNISAYDGMFLKVDTSLAADTGHKFTFSNVSTASTLWKSDSAGISTTKNVGIATTARSDYNLYVGSGTTTNTVAYFDGHISVAGSIFSREVINIDSVGIVTAANGFRATAGGIHIKAGVSTFAGLTTVTSADALHSKQLRVSGVSTFNNTVVGGATTELVVGGDLRVTGILTVGTDSITIDGSNNKVNVGTAITLDASANKILTPGLQITGTAQPFYPPVMTTTQRDALTVTEGAMIYNSTDQKIQFYNGSSWADASGVSLGLGMGVF